MNKLRGLAAAVIRDAAEHFLDGSADGTRIATMEFAWAADLLLKLSVMKREGDLVEKQDPKLYKQPLDLLKHLTHELDFDPFKGLKPNVREFFAGLLFGREDGWHRGARLEVEELRISIAGCVPLLEALCRDSGLAFATVAGKEFLEAAGAVKPEPERVEKLIQEGDASLAKGEWNDVLTTATSVNQQLNAIATRIPKESWEALFKLNQDWRNILQSTGWIREFYAEQKKTAEFLKKRRLPDKDPDAEPQS